MRLDGIHHVTGMTDDVQRNVDFWVGILGLRFVSKTLNFETTFRYHLYFGDETGTPGSVVTFTQIERSAGTASSPLTWQAPAATPGRGNIVSAVLRVPSFRAIEFWLKRLAAHGVHSEMFRLDPEVPERLVFSDFDGHVVELVVDPDSAGRFVADADDIPAEFRITGIDGVRSAVLLDDLLAQTGPLGFERHGDVLELRGATKTGRWRVADPADFDGPYVPLGIGVWNHVALDAGEELQAARDEADTGALSWTGVFDHYMFDSAYATTAGGFLELTSGGPGFLVNHRGNEELGEVLALSEWTEPLRERLEAELPPITNPRPRKASDAGRRPEDGAEATTKSAKGRGGKKRSSAAAPASRAAPVGS